jgi:hypothetical protein
VPSFGVVCALLCACGGAVGEWRLCRGETASAALCAGETAFQRRFPPSNFKQPRPQRLTPSLSLLSAQRSMLQAAAALRMMHSHLQDRPCALPPARTAPPRRCRVPAGAMSEEPAAHHLLPLAGDSRQVYLADPAAGLMRNCELLGFRIDATGPHGKALMALRAFDAGAVVGYMWGKLVGEDVHAGMHRAPHLDPTHRAGEEDYCAPIKQGTLRAVVTGGAGDVLLASEQCPMSLINHSHEPAERNVSIDLTATALQAHHSQPPDKERWTTFKIRASRRIEHGEQLCADYGWNAADWRAARGRERRALASPSPLPSASTGSLLHHSSKLFNLSAGSGCHEDKVQRQSQRLQAYLQSISRRAEVLAMPYHMATVPTQRARPPPMATELRRSTLPGVALLGLFPKIDCPPARSQR